MDDRMLFVIGAPRSGTTLLMRMLNVHPDVFTRPEPHLITPLAHLGYYAHVDKAPYDPFQSAEAARAWVAELPRGEADYLDAVRAYTDTIYGRLIEPSGKRLFVDKTPAYALVLPFLRDVYPNAVYAVLTRHPFAIFASYAASFFDDDWAAAHAFNPILERYVPAMASFLRRDDVPRRVHLHYEDLVAEPERELRRLCEIAGMAWDPQMVNYGQKQVEGTGLGDPVGVDQHDRPTTASVARWALAVAGNDARRGLLERMLATLEDDDLAAFGHTRTSVWDDLATVDADAAKAAQTRAARWDRHHLQRRVLLHARRNIHDNVLGKALQRVRFYCDVLLRE